MTEETAIEKGEPTHTAETAQSVEDKIVRYLLNSAHPVGGAKASWFKEALGFDAGNAAPLAVQIVFDRATATQTGQTAHGAKYNQVINIVGVNGKTIGVTFVWIHNNDGFVRLVTGIPAKR